MLKRKKQIIAKVMATTMLASTLATTFTSTVNGEELRSTVSETTIAGADRYKTAVEISKNYTSTSTHAVIVNGEKGIVDALTATPYASLKKAPILMTQSTTLNPDTKAELTRRGIKTVDIVGGVNSVSDSVKAEIEAMGITVNRIAGIDKYETSLKLAKEIDKLSDISKIAVANGEGLADAVSVAAPAAQNKMPIILAHPTKGLDAATKAYLDGENINYSYVIGGTSSVSAATLNSLPGDTERLAGGAGTGRAETNAAVVKKFYTSSTYDNIYVAKSGQVVKADEIADALAAGVLAASNQDPVILVGKSLANDQKTLLEGKEIDKITKVGGGIPTASINAIKDTQKEEVKEESKVSSVSVVDNKTIYLNGTDLDLIGKSDISITGNTVSSYSVNTSGTKATVVFTSAFTSGVTNTVKVTSNLGTATSHTFTYKTATTTSEISTVEAITKEVSIGGIQYLEFTVNNGQKKTIQEIKDLGWDIKFRSSQEIFYKEDKDGNLDESKISETGKLRTVTPFEDKSVFDYEVVLTKGDKEIKSEKVAVTVKDRSNEVKEINSYQLTFGARGDEANLNSTTVLIGENVKVATVKVTNLNGSESELTSGYEIESSNPNVLTVVGGETLAAKEEGTSKITLKLGDKTKEFTLTVKKVSGNERKIKSASFSSSSVKIIEGKGADVTITIKDQYGDPVIMKSTELEFTKIKNSNKQLIAEAKFTSVEGNKKGEYEAIINANFSEFEDEELEKLKAQSGTLKVKYKGDELTGSLKVNASPSDLQQKVSTRKIEIDEDSRSKDLTIDRYLDDSFGDEQDNELDLVLKGYSSAGYLVKENYIEEVTETEPNKNGEVYDIEYSVTSSNEKIATAVIDAGKIKVRCTDTSESGTVDIKLYETINDTKKQIGSTIKVTVNDSIPTITDITLKSIPKITKLKEDDEDGGVEFNVEDLFDITKVAIDENPDNYKMVVNGVTLKGLQSELQKEVLLSEENGLPILFLDNGNGIYDKDEDRLLAVIDLTTDATINNVSSTPYYEVDLDENQKGNIIVRLYHHGEYTPGKTAFKSVTIQVDVQDAE